MRRVLLLVIVAAAVSVISAGATSPPAGASCAGDPSVARAMVTGDRDSFSASSVDRTFQVGVRYLVDASTTPGPFALEPGELADTNCSATTARVDADAAMRPPGARMVAQDPADVASAMTEQDTNGGPSGLAIAGAVVGVVVLVVIALWLLFRRGSIADRARVDVPDPDDHPS